MLVQQLYVGVLEKAKDSLHREFHQLIPIALPIVSSHQKYSGNIFTTPAIVLANLAILLVA
jgi:hypothetical protein